MLKRWRGERWFHAHETARFDALNGLPLAGFKRRAAALAIDFCLILMLKSLFGGSALKHLFHNSESGSELFAKVLEEGQKILESVLYFGLALKLGKGQTPRKYLMKIKVLSLTHDSIGWWQAIERALGYGASLLEGGFGFYQYYLNRNRMCVHDRIAETIVVDLRKSRVKPALQHGHVSEHVPMEHGLPELVPAMSQSSPTEQA